MALDNIKAQIIKHYQRISDIEAFVTVEMVRNAYQGIGTEYETLLQAFDKENEAFAKRVGKDRSLSTYKKYLTVRKYLAEFIKVHYKRTDIAMNELTEDFIRDYCLYLRNEVGLAQSSVWIYSIPLKHIVTTAHYNGKIAHNPFAQYKVDPDHKERGFLTEDELQGQATSRFGQNLPPAESIQPENLSPFKPCTQQCRRQRKQSPDGKVINRKEQRTNRLYN